METLIPIVPALPLAGFAFTALLGRRLGNPRASIVPVIAVVASWAVAMLIVYQALTGGPPFGTEGAGIHLWTWIPAGAFQVEVGFFVDNLTACLLIVVTTIGMLVHIYSLGYM